MDSCAGSECFLNTAKRQRQYGLEHNQAHKRRLHFPEVFARKLCTENTLRGHRGCVNRLAWNEEGTYLASGSDDKQVLLWQYPDTERVPLAMETHHQANIFGVKFLPCSGSSKIVTGAMDYTVQLHQLDASPDTKQTPIRSTRPRRQAPDASSTPVAVHTTLYSCHKARVKDVEVEPQNPHLFWSASEDGFVRQYDIRCPMSSQREYSDPNVLLSVQHKSRWIELKGLSVNKAKPHQLAVASGDPYIRIYDRRMLSKGPPDSPSEKTEPILCMAPPHMCIGHKAKRSATHSHSTYIAFGNKGDKVVATYHGDQAYAFDVTGAGVCSNVFVRPDGAPQGEATSAARGTSSGVAQQGLSERAAAAKQDGNRAFFDKDNSRAIAHYGRAIRMCPTSHFLYANRAAAYLARGWEGDAWFALLDSEQAMVLEPSFHKAHVRRVKALKALGRLKVARTAVRQYKADFPLHVQDILEIEHDVQAALDSLRARLVARWEQRQQRHGQSEEPQRHLTMRTNDFEETVALEQRDTDSEGYREAEGSDSDGEGNDASSAVDCTAASSRGQNGAMSPEDLPAGLKNMGIGGLLRGSIGGRRMLQRFVGHCNVQTDIKEACFLGQNDELVAAGSDDGNVFIYSVATGQPVRVIKADSDVANCVQCHPHLPVLATSGIESVVRLWSPEGPADMSDFSAAIQSNQQHMQDGPQLLRGINPAVIQALTQNPELFNMVVRRSQVPTTGEELRAAPSPTAGAQDEQPNLDCRVT
ncbi:hypothetical protein WJX84_002533 [Apatococcus fuscideae]|uniref:WD and tetratricopeptide repeats protein 1 n=1 Tax=Apatococcus fuscideae TaxID=2026836 RepID=A0AAW1T301_9CHLO